jgi:Pyruvate/2-oxoacid:ferredoxin oxidoreductase delta subunit
VFSLKNGGVRIINKDRIVEAYIGDEAHIMTLEFKSNTQELAKGDFTIFPGLCKGCGLCIVKCPKKCLD